MQVGQLAASIKEWGFTVPVLVDEDDGIIAGHGRVLAAQKLGIETIPVMVAKGWSEAKKRAYVIADNKLALNAGWDLDSLKIEFQELGELDFDIELTGFDDGELSSLFLDREQGTTDPNAEWEGMPEFDQQDKQSFRHIIVHFENNDDVEDFARLIGQPVTDKTKSIWHPVQVRMDTESKRYASEDAEAE